MTMDAERVGAIARALLLLPVGDGAALVRLARRVDSLMSEIQRYRDAYAQAAPDRWHETVPEWNESVPVWHEIVPEAGGPLIVLARELRAGMATPAAVLDGYLSAIAARNGDLRAYVTTDVPRPGGAPGPLRGVPLAVKDLYHVAGVATRAGSRTLPDLPQPASAAAVRRLEAAGAVMLGKTATHEFGYGVTTDSPLTGPTRNPLDPARSPGGSSGGSAAAVAAGLAPAALGTDTAGSVRVPAACCGLVGLKPTYGLIPTQGIVALAPTLDHAGVLTQSVADAALLLSVLAPGPPQSGPAPGPRRAGPTVAGVLPCGPAPAGLAEAPLTAAVPEAWLTGPCEPGVAGAFQAALAQVRAAGIAVTAIDLPPLDLFHFVSRIITLAEAAAAHAPYLAERLPLYGPDVRARIELGQFLPARDYLLALQLRACLCRQMAAAMAGTDLLLTPTMPVVAPLIGERTWRYPGGAEEPAADALTRFTAPFNVTGQPAISLPYGTDPATGMPVGLQLVGRPGADATLLAAAARLQS